MEIKVRDNESGHKIRLSLDWEDLTVQETATLEEVLGEAEAARHLEAFAAHAGSDRVIDGSFTFMRALVFAKLRSKDPDATLDSFDVSWREIHKAVAAAAEAAG